MAPGIANKNNNVLPLWGNDKTMNLNNLILTNIQSSHYFKVNLFDLKTYHEVIDEIYYKVTHLEPWEKGSRKTSGQTGMCGGVRGVGAGGIVSTAFCLLYKLFTLKLTRKQVNGLITHCDSPYIRALGYMYIRYTQPPADLWDWFEPYLDDDEELDVKAGGGCMMNIGEMLRHFLTKLEWYSTLFPRIPVPIQKEIEKKLSARGPLTKSLKAGQSKDGPAAASTGSTTLQESRHIPDEEVSWGEAERISRLRRSASRERKLRREEKKENGKFEEEEDRHKNREKETSSRREERKEPRSSREEKREREWRDDRRSRERERDRRSNWDIADEIAREKERQKKERTDRDYRSRSRSRERRHRSRSKDRRRSRSHSRDHHHKDRRHRSKSRDHHVNHKSESRSRDRR